MEAIKYNFKDGEGLSPGQIHRLWQQIFMARLTYGVYPDNPEPLDFDPPNFYRAQLRFLAGAAETLGIYCYDAGFYYGKAKAQGGGASESF